MKTILLASRDLGGVTATANVELIYEWGEEIQSEFETALRVQTRCRFKETFEPALELHVGQDAASTDLKFQQRI